MIASLKGRIQHVGVDHAVIETHGVGYAMICSPRTLDKLRLALPEQENFLFIETQVREDAITLFGFISAGERQAFRRLTSVQGVGGRVALAILGTLDPSELARAILLQDKAMVARAPGVGPKLALRIVSELKDKAADFGPAPTDAVPTSMEPASPSADAVSALENLGFRTPEAMRAVAEAERELGEMPTGTLIREALKRASR